MRNSRTFIGILPRTTAIVLAILFAMADPAFTHGSAKKFPALTVAAEVDRQDVPAVPMK